MMERVRNDELIERLRRAQDELLVYRQLLAWIRPMVDNLLPMAEQLLQQMRSRTRALQEKDWLLLYLYMEERHPGFVRLLLKKVSVLSQEDYRLCLLFRLGFTHREEVATLLAISPESVTKRKQRMRKRFQVCLAPDLLVDMERFIQEL